MAYEKGTPVEIVTYRKMIQVCNAPMAVKTVLLDAIKVARESGREFVDAADVLVAIHKYTFVANLKDKLNSVGLTFDMLEDCLAGMDRQMSNRNSRIPTERMFLLATGIVADRAPSFNGVPPFGHGDLMFAAIASGSCVIDTVIRDGLQMQKREVLAVLGASDYIQLMVSMEDVMKEIESALMSDAASRG